MPSPPRKLLSPSVVAIIPARGGSKGIPGKNLAKVGGRSLIRRAVDAAMEADSVDRVLVSTDDDAIAAAGSAAGAEVVWRPQELAGDTATSESALVHALTSLGDDVPDLTVFVQCTSPFVWPADIDAAVAVVAAGADAALTGCRSHGFLWTPDDGGGVRGVNHDAGERLRRQDRPVELLENGAVYAMRTAGFLAAGHRFFGRVELVEVPARRSLEIDEPDDLALARALAPQIDDARAAARLPERPAALVMDFDGVMTDNRVLTYADGTEAVFAHRGDGMGIDVLRRGTGLPMAVISTEVHPVVAARCAKLGLECIHGVADKQQVFGRWCADNGFDPAEVIFVGNDINDLGCLRAAGCAVVVADGHPSVLAEADIVLRSAGGHGAVRELTDLLLAHL